MIAEEEDGVYLFHFRSPILEIARLRDGEDAGPPRPVASVTTVHAKIEPQWLAGDDLVYLGERIGPDGKQIAGQAIYRASATEPSRFSLIAEYGLGNFHLVAKHGAVRYFERIGTGHDAYYEDGFVAWDTRDASPVRQVKRLPEGATPTFPPYLHSFSHRQGDPTVTLASHRFSLKRTRAGNDATWAIERSRGSEPPQPITAENETVSCARVVRDRLIYLRGPAAPGAEGQNRLVLHLGSDPESAIEAPCGTAAAYRVSAGRSSLFHVHGELIVVATDRLRIFRLE